MANTVFKAVFCIAFISTVFSSCVSHGNNKETPSADTAVIAKGEALFETNCVSCHGFRQDGIGPQLSGITDKNDIGWIKKFISDPQQMIQSGDARAVELHKKFNTTMPSFAFIGDSGMNALVAYLHIHKALASGESADSNEIKDPFPAKIPMSPVTINLQPFITMPASDSNAPKARITKLDFNPATKEICILDLRGKLYKIHDGKPVVMLDMPKKRPAFVNQPGLGSGFGSFAFHPAFEKNGLLYTSHTEAKNTAPADFALPDSVKRAIQYVITEWKLNPSSGEVISEGRELLRINMVSEIHGTQEIAFNPNAKPGDKEFGKLYIGIGDGGSVENGYPWVPHNKSRPWGTIFRIDPLGKNSANGKYGIPDDNPFVTAPEKNILREIYALGFRNPHRITWDKHNRMFVCNIGQHDVESVYLVRPGIDAGWPEREGMFVIHPYGDINKIFPLPANDSIYHFTYPVAAYDHDEGGAIAGGFVYSGKNIPLLSGKFIFGDIPTGRLFYFDPVNLQPGKLEPIRELRISIAGQATQLSKAAGHERVEVRLGCDASGELYVLTKADGKVYRVTGASSNP